MIQRICDNVSWDLKIPLEMLPEGGAPFEHHFQSVVADNLIELAGRACYDSCKQEKTRATTDYHKHINETSHGSVQEHSVFTVEIQCRHADDANAVMWCCLNRPGVFVAQGPKHDSWNLRITANVRSIKEWPLMCNDIVQHHNQIQLGNCIQQLVKTKSPLALSACVDDSQMFIGKIVEPLLPHERWYNFYISDVSRGLTHELVRHKFCTAFSQRSTRYVDESESEWIWHPLLRKYEKELDKYLIQCRSVHLDLPDDIKQTNWDTISDIEWSCKQGYDLIVKFLEEKLISEGIDKFTARKQGRGAARGILGNALSTELVFSTSLPQAVRIIQQRASTHADAEIRILGNELHEILKEDIAKYMGLTAQISDCPDGIGKNISLVAN